MFFTQRIIKNVLCNKSKNASVLYVSLCVCLPCVQFFTAFEEAVLKLCSLVSALKSKMATISMETKRRNFFFLHIFRTDHNKCTMK